MVIIDPIVSIALGVWLYSQHFTDNGAVLALAAAGFTVMCGGVIVLTQTAPATMKADIPDEQAGGNHGTASSQSQLSARRPRR
jgi:hypothetical protein